MDELIFDVIQESDGGFCAECRTESIFAQADTWPALREDVRAAVRAFYFDQPLPARIQLRGVKEELLPPPER